MRMKNKLVGYYNYTVVLTYLGMLSGFFGIISVFQSNAFQAVVCLMFAGFCDMFDGAVAATRERNESEKCFGIQIDSLSDLVCFGVLPAVLTFSLSNGGRVSRDVAGLYVLCALIRLAYFNVDEQERQRESTGAREFYLGMPVTLAAVFVPLFYAAAEQWNLHTGGLLTGLLLAMALLFVLPIRLRKPGLGGKLLFVLCGAAELVLVFVVGRGR